MIQLRPGQKIELIAKLKRTMAVTKGGDGRGGVIASLSIETDEIAEETVALLIAAQKCGKLVVSLEVQEPTMAFTNGERPAQPELPGQQPLPSDAAPVGNMPE